MIARVAIAVSLLWATSARGGSVSWRRQVWLFAVGVLVAWRYARTAIAISRASAKLRSGELVQITPAARRGAARAIVARIRR